MNILTVNLLFGTLVFWIAARIYVLPKLKELRPQAVLLPILLLHGLRHLGLMFLTQGATYPGMPVEFARPAAYGDLLAAVLAVLAIPAIVTGSSAARVLVLAFNLEGTLDLLNAIVLANLRMALRRSWGLRTGSLRSGSRHFWSRTTSAFSCYGITGTRPLGDATASRRTGSGGRPNMRMQLTTARRRGLVAER